MAKISGSKLVKRARAQMARTRMREKEAVATAIGKTAGVATSVGLGVFEGKIPITIAKVPTKIIMSVAAYIASAVTKGNVSRAFEAVGDASSSVYAYKVAVQSIAKTEKPFVAGEETGYIEEV